MRYSELCFKNETKLPIIPLTFTTEQEVKSLFESKQTHPSEHAFLKSLCKFNLKFAASLIKQADISLSLNLEAIRGEKGAFDLRLHQLARPYTSQAESAENVLRLLESSEFTTDQGRVKYGYDKTARCQDAISYRAAPQTHGGVKDAFKFYKSASTHPFNEHQVRYATALLTTAIADLGNISERRSFRLTDTHLSYGLPTNLVMSSPGFNHGFPVVQAVATAALGELKTKTLHVNLNAFSSDGLALTANIKLFEALQLLSKIIAIEIYMSAQGISIVKEKLTTSSLGLGTEAAYKMIRQTIASVEENRYLISDLLNLDQYVQDGLILNAVETSIGQLK